MQGSTAKLDLSWLDKLPLEDRRKFRRELGKYLQGRKLFSYYPDEGPLRRELYQKHLEFFRAGAQYRERCFMAGNRVGKSEGAGGYEATLHMTGLYPKWWEGRRFDRPIKGWVSGKTNESTRDIVQAKLFGIVRGNPRRPDGTGLVPAHLLGNVSWKAGVPNLLDTIHVQHISGGWSVVGVKSYQQGRGSFEGTEQDLIWLDEEPPIDVYSECLIRTMTTDGTVLLTFTPKEGMSDVVMSYLTDEVIVQLKSMGREN